MIREKDQYFSINRILLLTVGLWPYQQSNFTTFLHILNSAILTTFVIFQLTTFVTLNFTLELLINVLSSASYFTLYVIKYYAFCFNIEDVKDSLMQLQHIYNELKDKNEIAIVKKYDCISTRYTITLTTLGIFSIFGDFILQFWINVVDVELSTNVSRENHFLFTMEYFIDQEKYFYLILLHINATICIGLVTMIAIGTMIVAYYHHICGMFQIVSYRIKHAISINIQQTITPKNKIWIPEEIICAIDIHRQAIKLTKNITSAMEIMLSCLTVCGVTSLSLNLFQIIASSTNDIEKCLMPFACASAVIIYMFVANSTGQKITDHNNHVFTTAYNAQWYKTPLHIQRMVLFLLQIRTRELHLNLGGLFDASIEGFATLVKASVSYFTVIHSTW